MDLEMNLSLKMVSVGIFVSLYLFLLYLKERIVPEKWRHLAKEDDPARGRPTVRTGPAGHRTGIRSNPGLLPSLGAIPTARKGSPSTGGRPSTWLFFLTWDKILLLGLSLQVFCFWPAAGRDMVLASGGAFIVWKVRRARQERDLARQVEGQLGESSLFLLNALRGGGNLVQALYSLVQEKKGRLTEEVAQALKEYEFGTPLFSALRNMVRRHQSRDLSFFVDALEAFSQGGGNPEVILTSLATTLEERRELWRELQAKAAESMISGVFLALLPAFLALVFYHLQGEIWLNLFQDPLGQVGLIYGGLSWAIGIFLILSLTRFQFEE